jgi:hypothetical protein
VSFEHLSSILAVEYVVSQGFKAFGIGFYPTSRVGESIVKCLISDVIGLLDRSHPDEVRDVSRLVKVRSSQDFTQIIEGFVHVLVQKRERDQDLLVSIKDVISFSKPINCHFDTVGNREDLVVEI